VLLKFGMGVEIDANTDGIKVNNERGGPAGSNPAEEAHALMNGTLQLFNTRFSLSFLLLTSLLCACTVPPENPQIRFAKSLGFYEDAEWTLNRASIGVRTLSRRALLFNVYLCLRAVFRDDSYRRRMIWGH
jgi:hypothetical protein